MLGHLDSTKHLGRERVKRGKALCIERRSLVQECLQELFALEVMPKLLPTKNLISVGQLCDDKQAVFSQIES